MVGSERAVISVITVAINSSVFFTAKLLIEVEVAP
jgi:hypothetical protein